MFIIDDSTPIHVTHPAGMSRGLVPRNEHAFPQGCYTPLKAFDMPLIPRDQYVERIKEQTANQSSLAHIRNTRGPNGGRIPSLDQDGIGYCWVHSGTMGVMLARAAMNEPYVRLSAFMVGCLIKNYQDEGGWGALGADFIAQHGVASVATWPEKSMSRSNDTPAMRADAAKYKISAMWVDLQAAVYDRNVTDDQACTSLLQNDPLIGDENWWGHSIIFMRLVLAQQAMSATFAFPDFGSLDLNDPKDAKVFGDIINKEILNSWTDGWGDNGAAVLSGTRAHLDGGCAIRAVNPATMAA